jgi:hypothetical protein
MPACPRSCDLDEDGIAAAALDRDVAVVGERDALDAVQAVELAQALARAAVCLRSARSRTVPGAARRRRPR